VVNGNGGVGHPFVMSPELGRLVQGLILSLKLGGAPFWVTFQIEGFGEGYEQRRQEKFFS